MYKSELSELKSKIPEIPEAEYGNRNQYPSSYAKVLFDYKARDEHELSIAQG